MTDWIGKAVSIQCTDPLGVFQGTIRDATPAKITISRAFRNGIPLCKQDMEITISASDIVKLDLIPTYNAHSSFNTPIVSKPTPIKHPNFPKSQNEESHLANKLNNVKLSKTNNYNNKSPPHETSAPNQYKCFSAPPTKSAMMIPPKVETKLGANPFYVSGNDCNNDSKAASKPIDIAEPNKSNGGNGATYRNDKTKQRRYVNKNEAFGTPVDDPMMDEEFDFEKNLALFNKKAIWNELDEKSKKSDFGRQKKKKYRHDENVISSEPTQLRQIELEFQSVHEFVTDDGLIIPSIPQPLRNRIQTLAESHGLSSERQCDIFARGAAEMALQLLGGARRLIPNNQHQWPTIVVVCDEPYNDKQSEIGLSTARQLASHGLKVMVFVKTTTKLSKNSKELELFTATGNEFSNSVKDLPSADLVILAVRSSNQMLTLSKWILENRSPVLAIDPPAKGIVDVAIKCSLLPILPQDEISLSACGKLYLCNLGIPDKFFRDAGIKYKSPFGHKFVIPIHNVE